MSDQPRKTNTLMIVLVGVALVLCVVFALVGYSMVRGVQRDAERSYLATSFCVEAKMSANLETEGCGVWAANLPSTHPALVEACRESEDDIDDYAACLEANGAAAFLP